MKIPSRPFLRAVSDFEWSKPAGALTLLVFADILFGFAIASTGKVTLGNYFDALHISFETPDGCLITINGSQITAETAIRVPPDIQASDVEAQLNISGL